MNPGMSIESVLVAAMMNCCTDTTGLSGDMTGCMNLCLLHTIIVVNINVLYGSG